MDTLESLRRQIEVAQDLRSVVSTMKVLSAVGLREYERSVDSLTRSVRVVQFGFQVLLRHHPELIPPEQAPEPHHTVAVVVGTDQGLCGSLNRQIVRYALDRLSSTPRLSFVAAGVRAVRELEVAGKQPEALLPLPNSVSGIPQAVRTTLLHLDRTLRSAPGGQVILFHHRPRGRSGFEPRTTPLIPLSAALLRAIARRPWPTRTIPTSGMEPARLLEGLTRNAMSYAIYRAYAEAKAAEHAARLAAMHNAEQSIGERLDGLRQRSNQARQESITAELLDVVSGFEAAMSSGRG